MSARSFWTNGAAQISYPGYDVFSAGADQLILNINEKVPQLLLLTIVNGSQDIGLGYSTKPVVLVTGTVDLGSLPGYGGYSGPCKPSPLGLGAPGANPRSWCTIQANGAYISVHAESRTQVSVYNRPLG